jgi:hypothetical protein
MPTPASVTVTPVTVHTGAVVEAKLTANPELALALTGNGPVPNAWLNKLPNAIVWLSAVTAKL